MMFRAGGFINSVGTAFERCSRISTLSSLNLVFLFEHEEANIAVIIRTIKTNELNNSFFIPAGFDQS